jgi:hypothetical protein
MTTAAFDRWAGHVDEKLSRKDDEVDGLDRRLTTAEKAIVDVRLDVRGLLVRVSIFAAIAAAIATALITPLIYLALAHFGATRP